MKLSLPRIGASCVVFVAVLSVLAGPASAKVTWRGIGPVTVGMSEDRLHAKLGAPTSARDSNTIGFRIHRYKRRKLEVVLYRGEVAGVHTTSRAHRTPWGTRVGSSYREMRRRVRGETCGSAGGQRVCSVGRGNAVIGFAARRGRIVLIEVGRAKLEP